MKARKILVSLAALALVVAISIGGTLAYLTSKTDTVTNTFTIGKVTITLDETKVTPDGVKDATSTKRVTENSYKLMPGHEYMKDPAVTIKADSEPAYVRMLVTVSDMAKLQAAFPEAKYADFYTTVNGEKVFLLEKLVGGWNSAVWAPAGYANGTYEFRYVGTAAPAENTEGVLVDTMLPALFTSVNLPTTVDKDALDNLNGIDIKIIAEAIQADGLTAEQAWGELNTTYHGN